METCLYSFLILAAFYFQQSGRYFAALVVGALCALTRYDGLIVPAVIVAASLLEYKKLPIAEAALPLSIYASWCIFAQLYFGHILPQSMLAKELLVSSHWKHEFIGEIVKSGLIFTLTVAGTIAMIVMNKKTWPFALWFVLFVAAYDYESLENFFWYAVPAFTAMCIIAACCIPPAVSAFKTNTGAKLLLLVLIDLAFIDPSLQGPYLSFNCPWDQYTYATEHPRYEGALAAAKIVKPGEAIAAGGIGMIGWTTNAYIYDLFGLVSPCLAPHKVHTSAFSEVLRDHHPEYFYDDSTTGVWPEILTSNYKQVISFRVAPVDAGLWQLKQRPN